MLRQLKLSAELKTRKNEQVELEKKRTAFTKRQDELGIALEQAENDEDINLVSAQIDELVKEASEADVDTKLSAVASEIQRIEGELAEVDKRANDNSQQTQTAVTGQEKTNERGNVMNRLQIRELMKTGDYYIRSEVKSFYEGLKNIRSIGGEGLTVPQIIVDRIMDIVGDYCTVYPIVDHIKAHGPARILIDTDTAPATWTEQGGAIPQGDVGTITNVDFDGFKIGKATFVDNAILNDSIINLDDYVVKKLARAIGLGLDLSILKGSGSGSKQPDGIIPKLEASHKVSVPGDKLIDIVKPIGLIDTGADSVGEIVAVMKRTTYYNRLLGFSINTNSDGNVVGKLPNIKAPDLLGLRVVFNNNLDVDTVLYGDFSKYTMVDREDIAIDKSEHVKFLEDQTAFRGRGRFDGKPTNANAFVLVTITETETASIKTFSDMGGEPTDQLTQEQLQAMSKDDLLKVVSDLGVAGVTSKNNKEELLTAILAVL